MVIQRKFIIIGTDDNRTPFFPPEVLEHIRHGKVFSGGVRHKEIVGNLLPNDAEWISITVPLDNVFSQYEKVFSSDGYEQTDTVPRQIIVFASGDPLFFGFANTVKRKLPDAEIKLYPSFNSLQTLAHRLVMPYDDMRTVSLTGRPWNEFDRALIERAPKIGILTDREHTPATIAARMLEYGYNRYTMYVGEHLGNPEKERIRHMTLQKATQGGFEHPNNLLLCATLQLQFLKIEIGRILLANHHQPCLPFGGTAGNAPVLPLRRLGPDGRRGLAVGCGGRLFVRRWTGTHGILFYGRRAPADIPCHACIPGTAAECGEEAAAGAIFRSGVYSRIFLIRRKTI